MWVVDIICLEQAILGPNHFWQVSSSFAWLALSCKRTCMKQFMWIFPLWVQSWAQFQNNSSCIHDRELLESSGWRWYNCPAILDLSVAFNIMSQDILLNQLQELGVGEKNALIISGQYVIFNLPFWKIKIVSKQNFPPQNFRCFLVLPSKYWF